MLRCWLQRQAEHTAQRRRQEGGRWRAWRGHHWAARDFPSAFNLTRWWALLEPVCLCRAGRSAPVIAILSCRYQDWRASSDASGAFSSTDSHRPVDARPCKLKSAVQRKRRHWRALSSRCNAKPSQPSPLRPLSKYNAVVVCCACVFALSQCQEWLGPI